MKLNYTTEDTRMHIELSGESVKDLFERLSEFQEIFEADTSCGCCNSTSIRFLARQVDDYKFYELSCRGCGARMSFGQAKKGGGLFPKRRTEDGGEMPHRGWSKFQPKTEAVGNGNGHAATNGAARPAPAKQDGVHVFLDWDAAENSKAWGSAWIQVAGVKYKMGTNGEYQTAK